MKAVIGELWMNRLCSEDWRLSFVKEEIGPHKIFPYFLKIRYS